MNLPPKYSDPVIMITDVSCPTCNQPVVDEKVRAGIQINEIAALGARLVELQSQKATDLRALKIQEVKKDLESLGAGVDADGYVCTDSIAL